MRTASDMTLCGDFCFDFRNIAHTHRGFLHKFLPLVITQFSFV